VVQNLAKKVGLTIETLPATSTTHADAKIGLGKFCDLRPQRVKLFDHIPH
jgi:hypothetical protein